MVKKIIFAVAGSALTLAAVALTTKLYLNKLEEIIPGEKDYEVEPMSI